MLARIRSTVPQGKEMQDFDRFHADLCQLSDNQMMQALELTQSDSGRHIASKLFTYIKNLRDNYYYYCKLLSKATDDESKRAIKILLEELRQLKADLGLSITLAAQKGLDDIYRDKDFAKKLAKLHKDIDAFLKMRRSGEHVDNLAHLNSWSYLVYYSTIVASYMTKSLHGFLQSLPSILSTLSRVFPPIIIAMDAITNISDLIYSLVTYSHLSEQEKLSGGKWPLTSSPLYNKGYFLRLAGNAVALSLNVFILLIFTGALFTTPFGWGLSAAVITAEWMASCVVPAWQARKNYKKLQNDLRNMQGSKELNAKIAELEATRKDLSVHGTISDINQQIKTLNELSTKVQLAEKTYLAKKADALWYFCSIAGSIIFACGFILPPLFLVGMLFLSASPVRTVYNWLADQYTQHYKDTSQALERISSVRTSQIQAAMITVNRVEKKKQNSATPGVLGQVHSSPSSPLSPSSHFSQSSASGRMCSLESKAEVSTSPPSPACSSSLQALKA